MTFAKFALKVCWRLRPWFPSEAWFLKVRFRLEMGHRLNLKHPKTFSEKIQWLKLYNRRPEYTTMVDKYAVKNFVAQKIGAQYVIPTLGVWDTPEEIEWDKLPSRFVLKTTHGGGNYGVVVCKDKSKLDILEVIEKLRRALRQDIAYYSCEWPYKNVPRKIIAEEYLDPSQKAEKSLEFKDENKIYTSKGNNDVAQQDLLEYKLFCFDGKVQFLKINTGRSSELHINFYNLAFELLPFGEAWYPPNPEAEIKKPENFDLMISLAERLSVGVPLLRVDLYNVNGKIYFGELTFFPASGLENYEPREWDRKIGDMLVLPKERITN